MPRLDQRHQLASRLLHAWAELVTFPNVRVCDLVHRRVVRGREIIRCQLAGRGELTMMAITIWVADSVLPRKNPCRPFADRIEPTCPGSECL